MGSDRHRKEEQKERLPTFIPLFVETLNSAAWRALSHGAKALYVALRMKYSRKHHNNGRLYLSQRDARAQLGSGLTQVARWYRELEHFGFIVKVTPGTLGMDGKGIAPHFRITDLGCNREKPTKDFLNWNGLPFVDTPKPRKSKQKKSPFQKAGTPCSRNLEHTGVPESGNG